MKTLYASLMVAGLVVIAGCNKSSTGGPGGPEGTFKLKGPSNVTATEVAHGQTKNVEITVDADKNFKEDVTLTATVEPADKGVTAELDPKTVKASDPKKTNLKITATEKAAPGEYTVNVKGKPTKGPETTVPVKVKVPEKK